MAHPGRIFEKKSTGKFDVEFFSKISIRLINSTMEVYMLFNLYADFCFAFIVFQDRYQRSIISQVIETLGTSLGEF